MVEYGRLTVIASETRLLAGTTPISQPLRRPCGRSNPSTSPWSSSSRRTTSRRRACPKARDPPGPPVMTRQSYPRPNKPARRNRQSDPRLWISVSVGYWFTCRSGAGIMESDDRRPTIVFTARQSPDDGYGHNGYHEVFIVGERRGEV